MPRVSSKRQITLPVAGCEELGIHAGDDVEMFEKFLYMLNDLDDVQNIYHNAEL